MSQLIVLKPPNEAFTHTEQNKARVADKIVRDQTGGWLVYYKGHPYPEKAFPFPEAFAYIDPVKRSIMNVLKVISKSTIAQIGTLWACLVPGNRLFEIAVRQFFEFTATVVRRVNMKPEYLCVSAKEIRRAIIKTAEQIGGDKEENVALGIQIAQTACLIWEFDNAYRYRGQDLAAAFDKKLFKTSPLRALWRICDTIRDRERVTHIASKWSLIKIAIVLIFLNGKVRRAAKVFVTNLDLTKLKMDVNDYYWSYFFADYNFNGHTLEDRAKERERVKWPTQM